MRSWRRALVAGTWVGLLASAVGCHRDRSPSGAAGSSSGTSQAPAPRPTAPPNALPFTAASVAAVLNPQDLPRYAGPTGSVEGTVLVDADAPDVPVVGNAPADCPRALDPYRKLFRAGPARADGLHPVADAVVVVTGYSGFYVPDKDATVSVSIAADCTYTSHTLALTFGQRLEISNESATSFAPFLQGAPDVAVMVAPPLKRGDPAKLYPPQAGHFGLGDRMLPFVRGDVYVFRHPFHAVTDTAGHFRIDGVPVGSLRVGARLAAIGSGIQKAITVRENVVESAEIVLTYAPGEHRGPAGARGPQEDRIEGPPESVTAARGDAGGRLFGGPVKKRTDPGGKLNPND